MQRIPRLVLSLVCGLVLACGVAEARKQPAKTGSGKPLAQLCGGIGGMPCPGNKECFSTDAFPDAMGVCIAPRAAEEGRNRCAAVRCMLVECGAGEVKLVTPESCCGMCVPAPQPRGSAQCRTVAQCEGLPHIQCVGSWSCVQGQCQFNCETGSPQ